MLIQRHSTAIRRYALSRPVAVAIDRGLLTSETSIFDYGCGLGDDIDLLRRKGFEASGWDPHHRPDAPLLAAPVVNLGYVLNVIEDTAERATTLKRAYDLAEQCLVVAVRVDQSLEGGTPFADGVVTGRQSFQKIFLQSEFRDYVADVLGTRPFMAGLGLAFVFKNQDDERSLISSLALQQRQSFREEFIRVFKKDRIAKQFTALVTKLGRFPIETEFPKLAVLKERFGSIIRIQRLANAVLQSDDLDAARDRRREDLLVYLAMTRLQGLKPPPFRLLPEEIKADIKMLWPSYQATIAEGDKFLYQIGRPELVKAACVAAPTGKVLPDALYFHRSAEEQQHVLIRLLLFAAKQVVGDVDHDIVKVTIDGRGVSFLKYANFEDDPHPALEYSFKVTLALAKHSFRDYRDSLNPPILHRKESLIDPLHPRFAEFRFLTEREEQLDLLSRTDIGFKRQWEALLLERGLRIVGHSIAARTASE